MDRMLTTEEAARRLGVKVPTLYAYVSRGLLESHPDPARRGSLFDLDEIEALAARSRGGRQTATRLATITTAVTQLDQQARPDLPRPGRHRPGADVAASRRWPSSCGSPRAAGTGRAPDLGPCPLTADARAHALGAGPVRGDRSPPFRPAPGRGRPRRPPRHRRADRRRGAGAAGRGPGRLHRGAAHRPPRPRPTAAVPTAAVNAALDPHGGPRARHLDDGRARGRVGALRSLRRAVGRAGHPGRAAARRREPAGLRAAGRGRARRRAARAERRARASVAGCPASATPSTRTATPASTRC